jgi:hypothetical protein
MHLSHLGLPVLDAGRSLDFYLTYFGFDPGTALALAKAAASGLVSTERTTGCGHGSFYGC